MHSSAFSKSIEQLKTIPQELQAQVLAFIKVLTGSSLADSAGSNLAIKGTYQNGAIQLSEAVDKREGQRVIVTFLDEELDLEDDAEALWPELDDILNECQISTGISDLVSQHDHYRR